MFFCFTHLIPHCGTSKQKCYLKYEYYAVTENSFVPECGDKCVYTAFQFDRHSMAKEILSR